MERQTSHETRERWHSRRDTVSSTQKVLQPRHHSPRKQKSPDSRGGDRGRDSTGRSNSGGPQKVPPAPVVDDTAECWLPTDALMQLEFQGSSEEPGKSCSAKSAHESLVAGFRDSLQEQCEALGQLIESRLADHHDSLLRKLESREPNMPEPGSMLQQLANIHVSGSQMHQNVSDPPPSADDKINTETSQATVNPDRAHDYNEHERLRQQKSKKKKKAASFDESAEITVTTCNTALRARARHQIEAAWFESLIGIVICLNVVFLGIEVQFNIDQDPTNNPVPFKPIGYVFSFLFFCELVLRMWSYGLQHFFCDIRFRAWNICDFWLVLISLMETMLDFAKDMSPKLGYARVIRVARTVRILRVVRIMKFFRPLRILVYSVLNTVRSLFWTLVLLGIIVYLFGIVFTMASTDALLTYTMEEDIRENLTLHFGSLWRTVYSLFKAITGGMDWHVAADALQPLHYMWTWLFIAYIALSHFAVLNVVTGVVCQTAIESARMDQDIVVQSQLAMKQRYVKQLQDLFAQFDCTHSGHITLQEFEERLQDDSLGAYFEGMDLTVDEAWSLFKLLDENEACVIDLEEFVSGCLRLRGTARSIDVHMLMYESKWTMKKLATMMASIEELRETWTSTAAGAPKRARKESKERGPKRLESTRFSVGPDLL